MVGVIEQFMDLGLVLKLKKVIADIKEKHGLQKL
jgi:hypothetical protein